MSIFRATRAAAAAVFAAALLALPAATALADDPDAESVDITAIVAGDGTLTVSQTITFAAGQVPEELVVALETTKPEYDYKYFKYEITDITFDALDATGQYSLADIGKDDGERLVVKFYAAQSGATSFRLAYTVKGAAQDGGVDAADKALTSVEWNYVQGLNVGAATVTGEIHLTTGATDPIPVTALSIDCEAGALSGLGPCKLWAAGTHDSPNPTFTAVGLKPGNVVSVSVGVAAADISPNAVVKEHWTLDRAFSTGPLYLLVALGTLALGALAIWAVWRAIGRDVESKAPTLVASFVPTGPGTAEFEVAHGVRPGHIGTVADEHVDPIDVTATLLDLAMRGWLRIVELPKAGPHAPLDWTFERLAGPDELRPFEKTLLDAIAPAGAAAVPVSQIGPAVAAVVPKVRDQLYDDVVEQGWFSVRPDTTRTKWHAFGWAVLALAIAACVCLVLFTRFGLLGLCLVALGVGLHLVASTMPRRTGAGASLLAGLHVLSVALQTQPLEQIPKDKAYEEISQVLPYAVVLGGRERWIQALVDADNDPGVPDPDDLPWYHAPGDWSLSDLPAAFDAFIAAVQGRLYARA